MARWFMIAVGIVYLVAAVAALFERKWPLFIGLFCWGAGGIAWAYVAYQSAGVCAK